jgi:hydrogenase maturation protease
VQERRGIRIHEAKGERKKPQGSGGGRLMARTLVIGYGNLDRADDGVAFYVINALRQRLGQKPLPPEETGMQELGSEPDSVFFRQLLPEWMETAAAYDQLVFVDAHVHTNTTELSCVPVVPGFVSAPFTHHVTPAMFLAMIETLYHREPTGHLVSIRGHDFDFRRGLSPEASRHVEPAVEIVLRLPLPASSTPRRAAGAS